MVRNVRLYTGRPDGMPLGGPGYSHPMTPGDDQDVAEAFDTDKLDDDRDEPVGQLTYPPDRLLGADDPTADDLVTDSVASREDRLEPDPLEEISGVDGGHDGASGPDRTGDDEVEEVAGRLVEPGAEDDALFPVDVEPDALAAEASDGEDLSSEEAAMHIDEA